MSLVEWIFWIFMILAIVGVCVVRFLWSGERSREIAEQLRGPEGNVPDPQNAMNLQRVDSTECHILQQLTRVRDANGRECIHGNLAAEFASGERQTALYIAFCPPFEYLPDVEAEIANDVQAEVKLVQVLHNGAQLEVRLPQPASSPTSITIALFAAERTSGFPA
jgi:hypothetical protein